VEQQVCLHDAPIDVPDDARIVGPGAPRLRKEKLGRVAGDLDKIVIIYAAVRLDVPREVRDEDVLRVGSLDVGVEAPRVEGPRVS
jgi:hypothetical protein